MSFIPFGFYKTPAGGGVWTPADLPNLYDYWEADSGTTGTTNVSAWAGKENGNTFVYGGNSQGAELILAESSFNNQDILRFDRANNETLHFTLDENNKIGTSTQVNFSMYANPEALASGNWRMFMGFDRREAGSGVYPSSPEFIMGSNSSALKVYEYDGGGATTTLAQSTTPKQLMTMVLDYANNQGRIYFGTTQDTNSPITTNPSNVAPNGTQNFVLFNYNSEKNPPELPGSGDLGGVAIWTGNTDFSTNLSNLEAYFQAKYGA